MLLSIVPVQGVRLADGAELDLGNATLAVVTTALVDEHVDVLRRLLERNATYSRRPDDRAAHLQAKRDDLHGAIGSPAVVLRENRTPDLETEGDRLLLLAEDAIDRLRLALFLNDQWRFTLQRETRFSISVGSRPIHSRHDAYYMSLAGGGAMSSWSAVPVPVQAAEPHLEAHLKQLDAAGSARAKTKRAYRLLSDALEITRPENFLVWAAIALEALLLGGGGQAVKSNLARRVKYITGSSEHEESVKDLYAFRSDVVHGRSPNRKRSVDKVHSRAIKALRQIFLWTLQQSDIDACLEAYEQQVGVEPKMP